MKKNSLLKILLIGLILCFSGRIFSQETPLKDVTFKNAPVLFKKEGKSFQQVLASFKSDAPGKVVFSAGNRELLSVDYRKGDNRFLLTVPAVSKPVKTEISVRTDGNKTIKYPVTLLPPKNWEILFVQHSHTDIGYTRPQSEILAEHMRYIDYALDYCDQTDNLPDEAKFRWTCESAWVTREYLRSRPSSQIGRLKKRIAEGRIEVTAMYANMAEISDENIMFDFLQPLKDFNRSGIPVRTAMQNDVNGIAWCMPDYFKNTGVKYLVMGINETRSILPFDIPTCFWWESP
jgi:alpha-mannosidase